MLYMTLYCQFRQICQISEIINRVLLPCELYFDIGVQLNYYSLKFVQKFILKMKTFSGMIICDCFSVSIEYSLVKF
jgi:hypothetical protein